MYSPTYYGAIHIETYPSKSSQILTIIRIIESVKCPSILPPTPTPDTAPLPFSLNFFFVYFPSIQMTFIFISTTFFSCFCPFITLGFLFRLIPSDHQLDLFSFLDFLTTTPFISIPFSQSDCQAPLKCPFQPHASTLYLQLSFLTRRRSFHHYSKSHSVTENWTGHGR